MTRFNKGDRVRFERFTNDPNAVTYTVAVAEPDQSGFIIAVNGVGEYDVVYEADLEAVPTFPERWINVWDGYTSIGYQTREDADKHAAGCGRIAVLHLHPDGTITREAP